MFVFLQAERDLQKAKAHQCHMYHRNLWIQVRILSVFSLEKIHNNRKARIEYYCRIHTFMDAALSPQPLYAIVLLLPPGIKMHLRLPAVYCGPWTTPSPRHGLVIFSTGTGNGTKSIQFKRKKRKNIRLKTLQKGSLFNNARFLVESSGNKPHIYTMKLWNQIGVRSERRRRPKKNKKSCPLLGSGLGLSRIRIETFTKRNSRTPVTDDVSLPTLIFKMHSSYGGLSTALTT